MPEVLAGLALQHGEEVMSWQKGIWEEVFGEPWSRDSQERVTRQYLLNALQANAAETWQCSYAAQRATPVDEQIEAAACAAQGSSPPGASLDSIPLTAPRWMLDVWGSL